MDNFMMEMFEHWRNSQIELADMYNKMIERNVITELPDHEFGGKGHALRVTLPCGINVSLSRSRAFEQRDRNACWEIALIGEDDEIMVDAAALHPDDEDPMDPMIKILGNLHDYDSMENELRRLNEYYENK